MERERFVEYFEEVEITREYKGYFCSMAEAISIVVLGGLCGLRSVNQIHQWAESEKCGDFFEGKIWDYAHSTLLLVT